MSAKIIKTYTEKFPNLRLIGKRYTEKDRINGSFGHIWGEWFSGNMFAPLEELPQLDGHDNGYLGAMRINNGEFEYWIGLFFKEDTTVPTGYDYTDINACNYLIFHIYGNEQNGEVYGMESHNDCLAEMDKQGLKRKEDYWCFERYNCPRFTTPDEKGNIILDYGISLEE